MPVVQIDMLSGRTIEQKRAMVQKVTQAIASTIGCSEGAVTIVVHEIAKENFAEGGALFLDK